MEFRLGTPIDTPERLRELEAEHDAIFLGIGLGDDVDVRYDGDERQGVWSSLRFIERLKRRLPIDLGERVVVIGGGNTAIDVAREARGLGADVVTLAYRRTEAEMPAYPHEVEEAREEGIAFQFLSNPIRLRGQRPRRSGRLPGDAARRARRGRARAGRSRCRAARSAFRPTPSSRRSASSRARSSCPGSTVSSSTAGRSRSTTHGRTTSPRYFSARRRGQRRRDASSRPWAARKRAARAIDALLRSET